jgi:hypothetical protein
LDPVLPLLLPSADFRCFSASLLALMLPLLLLALFLVALPTLF